jgi:hypothetical protein
MIKSDNQHEKLTLHEFQGFKKISILIYFCHRKDRGWYKRWERRSDDGDALELKIMGYSIIKQEESKGRRGDESSSHRAGNPVSQQYKQLMVNFL